VRDDAALRQSFAEAVSDLVGYSDHVRRLVCNQHALEPHNILAQHVGGGRVRRLVSDQRTQLLVGNNGAQIVEKAGQECEHRLIALNAPAVNAYDQLSGPRSRLLRHRKSSPCYRPSVTVARRRAAHKALGIKRRDCSRSSGLTASQLGRPSSSFNCLYFRGPRRRPMFQPTLEREPAGLCGRQAGESQGRADKSRCANWRSYYPGRGRRSAARRSVLRNWVLS
jgi:hypothetical protein